DAGVARSLPRILGANPFFAEATSQRRSREPRRAPLPAGDPAQPQVGGTMTAPATLQPIAAENPPFWPEKFPPGTTEHELYEVQPILPQPHKPADLDAIAGTWIAWMPRHQTQKIELTTEKYNPDTPDDPRRKLTYVGPYNEVIDP